MQELWHRPIVLMMVLAGAYFAVRTNRQKTQKQQNQKRQQNAINRRHPCQNIQYRGYAMRRECTLHLQKQRQYPNRQ